MLTEPEQRKEFLYPSTRNWISMWTVRFLVFSTGAICFFLFLLVLAGAYFNHSLLPIVVIAIPIVFVYRGRKVSEKVIIFEDRTKMIRMMSTNWYGHNATQRSLGSYESFIECKVKTESRTRHARGRGTTTQHTWIQFHFQDGIQNGQEYIDVPSCREYAGGLSMEEVADQINSWWKWKSQQMACAQKMDNKLAQTSAYKNSLFEPINQDAVSSMEGQSIQMQSISPSLAQSQLNSSSHPQTLSNVCGPPPAYSP